MGRIVAVGGGTHDSASNIHSFGLNLTFHMDPKLLFIGTAGGDSARDADSFRQSIQRPTDSLRMLCLVTLKYNRQQIRRLLHWANVIYIADGDPDFAMYIWKQHRIDELLLEVYHRDSAVLISSGCCTQVLSRQYRYSLLPHYERYPQPEYDNQLFYQHYEGYALESNTAFVENTGTISFVKSDANAHVYRFFHGQRCIEKKECPVILLS